MYLILKPSWGMSHRRTITGRSLLFAPGEPVEVTTEEANELRDFIGHSIVLTKIQGGVVTGLPDYDATNRFLEGNADPHAAPEPEEPGGAGDGDNGDIFVAESEIPTKLHEPLIAAGLDTLQKIDAYLAVDGKTLEEISGIGPASARQILEALARHTEGE